MATVIITEKKSTNSPGWIYAWKCPACETEVRKLEYVKQTRLECYKCRKQIFRASIRGNEWETK